MIHLRVLGGALLERDGVPARGRVAQSHHLALLALLSTAPGRAASRERIIGCLWPDRTTDRARHRLSVALHALRRGLDPEALVTSGDMVVLSSAHVRTDAGDFLDAIGTGRFEMAVDLYGGPFLDGFYLRDALDFEQWAEGERQRLAGLCRWALGKLAEGAHSRGDIESECRWRRRLVALVPYEASEALALMRTLSAKGDLAEALAHARSHAVRVEADLGVRASPEVDAIIVDLERAIAREGSNRPPPRDALEIEERPDPSAPAPPPKTNRGEEASLPPALGIATRRRPRRSRSRQLAVPAFAFVGAIIAFWALAPPRRLGAPAPSGPSVAVLPFASATTGADALALRLGDDVRATLAYIPNLRVLDGSASVQSTPALRGIPNRPRVDNLIQGTLRATGPGYEALVRLVDARSGEVRWENHYRKAIGDTAALIESLSMSIADDLRLEIAAYEPHEDTANERAYDSFLEGVFAHRRVTEESLWIALQHYRRAWEEDPRFALPHAIAGGAYMKLAEFSLASHVAYEAGREHVLEALVLDSLLPEAHAQLGRLQLWWDRDFAAAERTLRRVIMLQPTYPDARTYYAYYLLNYRQDYDGAIRSSRLALELDPLNTARSRDVEIVLYQSRRYAEVADQTRHTWSLNPDVAASFATSQLAGAYRELGMYEEAIAEYTALQERTRGLPPVGLAITYARMGRVDEARAILRAREARAEATGLGGDGVAMIYAALGDADAAFRWLDEVFDRSPGALVALKTSPPFDPLREDPRFQDLLVRLGLEKGGP